VWTSRRPMFALRTVRIEALPVVDAAGRTVPGTLRHVNATTIRSDALPIVRSSTRANFFTVDLDIVRRAFEAVPWVRHAQVRREWPNRLVVGIEEQQLLAAWDDGRFVNTFGELFTANAAEAEEDVKYPAELSGPAGTERDVASRYLDFKSWFARLSLVPDQVTLSPRYAWTVHFENGTPNGLTVDLGRERDGNTVPERVLRIIEAWPALIGHWPRPTLIDLRYPNGFALRAEGLRLADDKPAPRPAAANPTPMPAAKKPAQPARPNHH
jgi:cell division protein FtsQ